MNWTTLISQCVMCFRTAAAQQTERSRVMNSGILVLAIPPVLILGLLVFLAWQKNKAQEEMRLRLNEVYAGGMEPADKRLLTGNKAKVGSTVKERW